MAANQFLETLKSRIEPGRVKLLEHGVYRQIGTVQHLRAFMEGHVYAVWDFMSLLKALQQNFSPVQIPWVPPSNPVAARLVNEIVLGEETDERKDGSTASHYQLYREAMQDCGADLTSIDRFVDAIRQGKTLEDALLISNSMDFAKAFVRQTFSVVDAGDVCELAAAFTYGREDLLPDVFQKIVDQLNNQADGQLDSFLYYLDRHIELDGDQHGPMAEQLMESLCGDDPQKWERATVAAEEALESRLKLWDAMEQDIIARQA